MKSETLNIDQVVDSIVNGSPMAVSDAENLSRFVQTSQSKLDLAMMAIGAYYVRRFGRSAKLLEALDIMTLPQTPEEVEIFKKNLSPADAAHIRSELRSDMATSHSAIKALSKQPTLTSPETMFQSVSGEGQAVQAGTEKLVKITPERRQRLRNVIEVLAEKAKVRKETAPAVMSSMVRKKTT